jgi:glycosyltransferase involved in cell wall biosynthesis
MPSSNAPAVRRESVLLVTGAYYPEISAAGIQCRAMAAVLRDQVRFGVLTTAIDPSLPASEVLDGIPVYRIVVDVRSRWSKATATLRLLRRLLQISRDFAIVHLHGFSQKNVPVTWLARLTGKRVVLTLHTSGQDEPDAVRRSGPIAYRSFLTADVVLAVSPGLRDAYVRAGVSPERVRLAPNGIDTTRFHQIDAGMKAALRKDLGLPDARPIVLFVGFFSRDKRPDLLFRAWTRARKEYGVDSTLVFVGATADSYYEIDERLAREIRDASARSAEVDRVVFVPPTNDVARYFQAADMFVLASVREANPVALLEAMASGLPSVAARLPGATDVIIDDGVNGRLFAADDEAALARAIGEILSDLPAAQAMGARARETIVSRFDRAGAAERWLAAYRDAPAPL